MANLNLDHLATFRLVVSRGSFSGAAEVLGLSQPAVSLQVRQLEQLLQARLVERTGRGIKITQAGEALLAHSEEIDRAVSAAIHSVAAQAEAVSGSVTIGSGATACIHLLPPVLQQLRQHFPLLSVRVRTGNTLEIVRAVEENRIDIGLVTLPAAGKNLHISTLVEDAFVGIISDDARALIQDMNTEKLQALPLILFESGSSTRTLIDGWFQAQGATPQPVMQLGSIEAIKRMVQTGFGYSIVPRMSVEEESDRPGLRLFPLMPPLNRTLGTVMRQDKVLSRGMREVLTLLAKTGRRNAP